MRVAGSPRGGGRPAAPTNVFAYLIRRLFAAIVLMLVVSMITFAIFYLVPRLAGATPETLATRYVGRTANAATVHEIAKSLGFYDPIWVQYWHWLQADLRRRQLRHRAPRSSTAPPRAWATPSRTTPRCGPTS